MSGISTTGAHTAQLDNVRPARWCHLRRIALPKLQRSSQYLSLEVSITTISTPRDVGTDSCALQLLNPMRPARKTPRSWRPPRKRYSDFGSDSPLQLDQSIGHRLTTLKRKAKSRATSAHLVHGKFTASDWLEQVIDFIGGCSRTRTCDPLIKSPRETQQIQWCFPWFMARSTHCKALKMLEWPSPLGNRGSCNTQMVSLKTRTPPWAA
jgi:hypothetical protein